MKYYSTKNKSSAYSLSEAVLKGLPDDKGLFMPEEIPQLPAGIYSGPGKKSLVEIAYGAASAFLHDDVPAAEIQQIVSDSISFDAPVVQLDTNIFVLELFHGPTLAFKDFGARFMSRLMSYLIRDSNQKITILVATSGDTGSAVANGFYQVEGIDVVILYPSGKVSRMQEQQLTTLGNNITALEVGGTFDDCQEMVKQAFTDPALKNKLQLSSANSINISRLIPQSFYYFYAYAQLDATIPVVFSVPSGNFGNLTAGLIAKRMGLPVDHFVASTNVNKIVPEYLRTGLFKPSSSLHTISNAMDVGNPSNFERMLELYDNSEDRIRKDINGFWYSDEETKSMMREVYEKYHYVIDPHGAVGMLGLKKDLGEKNSSGVVLETAHPAKFKDVVEETLKVHVELPEQLKEAAMKKKVSVRIQNNYSDLREFLMSR